MHEKVTRWKVRKSESPEVGKSGRPKDAAADVSIENNFSYIEI